MLAPAELTCLSFLRSDDFPSFLDAQVRVDAAYQDQALWTRKSILSTAGSGKFSSDRTGLITGSLPSGGTAALARIVLADFNNPSGLLRVGDNMLQESGNSGSAQLGFALEGSQSQLSSGALEMSNVDLAQEFTNMIVAQRAFQANGKVVSTSDEMLSDLMAIKR